MTSAVTGSTAVPSANFPRCPASSTRSTSIGCRLPDARVTSDSRLPGMSDTREFKDIRTGAAAGQAEDAPALPVDEFMAGLEALQAEVATAKNVVWERVADGNHVDMKVEWAHTLGITDEELVSYRPMPETIGSVFCSLYYMRRSYEEGLAAFGWAGERFAASTGYAKMMYEGMREHYAIDVENFKVHAYAEEDHGQMADFLLRQVAQTAGQQRRIRRAIEHVLTLRNARTIALNRWVDEPGALRPKP